MTAARLGLVDVTRRFGDVAAVDGLDLALEPGSFTALLGPSGCGKSTTLALVAGLLAPSAGDVLLDGESVLDQPPEKRPVSLVFQKPLLFPHLTVEQNVAFGLRMRRVPRAESRRRVHDMLERVRLADLAGRRVGELSGGQEQRVSLARALVLEPRLLLLDEPFSQLDAGLRREMRALVRGLHDESDVTTIFVTHDQDEAVEVADEIVLMLDGALAGRGAPERFYTAPPTLAAARFFGAVNEIAGEVIDGRFMTADKAVDVPTDAAPGASILVVRPEALLVSDETAGAVRVTVEATRFAGTHVVVDTVLPDGSPLRLHQPVGSAVPSGGALDVAFPPERCTVLPAEST